MATAPEGSAATGGISAAFFDLDRTLMSGSSGFHWARAAAGAGLISRRRLAADAYENVKFRLRGSTDEGTDKVMRRVGEMLRGKRRIEFQRLGPQVLAGILPRLYPQMLAVPPDPHDARGPGLLLPAAP